MKAGLILIGITLILTVLFCIIFKKTVKNNCTVKTTAISLGLSLSGALGLVCFFVWLPIAYFGEVSLYPISYPVSIIGAYLCLVVFLSLCAWYIFCRIKNKSFKGVVIDVLTSALYLPVFFFAASLLYDFIK